MPYLIGKRESSYLRRRQNPSSVHCRIGDLPVQGVHIVKARRSDAEGLVSCAGDEGGFPADSGDSFCLHVPLVIANSTA